MRILLIFCFGLITLGSIAQQQNHISGELIVQFAAQTNPDAFARKFESEHEIGIAKIDVLSDIGRIYLLQFADPNTNLDRAIRLLMHDKEINLVQKNHFVSNRETIPTDALFSEAWHLKNTGGGGGLIDADIDATEAWDMTTGGITTHNDTIVVCIIEGGGVDIYHEDLVNNIWKNYAEIPDDGIDNDGNGYVDDFNGWNVQTETDEVGAGSHGTRVAGIIGATGNNGIGHAGVNWKVKMMIIKGQTASNEASVIAAYSYPLTMRKRYNDSFGEEGAFVVVTNSSWGIDGGTPEESPLWCAMYDTLGAYGIISVGATTNDDNNVEVTGDMPTNCTSNYFIGVTMTNNLDVRAGSGYGTTSVDLAAPGFGIKSTTPGNSYGSGNGTSFATPCVTGAVALVYAAPCAEFINLAKYNPAAAALQVRQHILDGVDPVDGLITDVATGGRLNVNNALNLLTAACDEDACVPPYNMRAEDLSDTSATLNWAGFTTDYILSIQEAGGAIVEIPLFGETTIHFDTLKPCTAYTFSVRADCGGGVFSDESFPITFTTDGCCINPPLMNPLKTENSLTVSWNEVLYATQYNVRYAPIDTEDWTELTDVTAPITVEDLEKCTEYQFQIYTICTDSTRGFGESHIFRTKGCGVCTELDYCPVIGANANLEWIDSIYVNGFSNKSGHNNGWLRSEQIITALTPGESYSFRVVPDFSESTFTEHYSIYIDFDQNGVFDTPGDRVLDDYLIAGPMTQTISIPNTAAIGVTKIRIAMAGLMSPNACPTSSFFGEYEDYCVYIGPQLGIDENENTFKLYPNPAQNQLHVETTAPIQQITIFSQDGKAVWSSLHSPNNEVIDIQHLSAGIYIIQVETNNRLMTQKFVKN